MVHIEISVLMKLKGESISLWNNTQNKKYNNMQAKTLSSKNLTFTLSTITREAVVTSTSIQVWFVFACCIGMAVISILSTLIYVHEFTLSTGRRTRVICILTFTTVNTFCLVLLWLIEPTGTWDTFIVHSLGSRRTFHYKEQQKV